MLFRSTAGERVFVDFAGHTMEVIDGATGEIQRVEVFVAVLGASSYVFAEATWTPTSTFALSRGLYGRAGMIAVR